MQLTEQPNRDTDGKNRRKNALPLEEEENTMTYAPRGRQKPLNRQTGVFHQQKLEGINTGRSVFDETAIFITREGRE